MASLIKTPEQLLASRPLKDLLAAKPKAVYSVRALDSVLSALQLMADHGIGFLVVLDGERLVGVLSERDYARKVALRNRSSKETTVRDIMTESVARRRGTQAGTYAAVAAKDQLLRGRRA